MANTKITADNLAANAVTSASIADNSIGITQLNVSDGTNGQVLTTNGSGTLSFSTISGYTDSDVETYLNTSTIYTDPTNNRLGIGTASPAYSLDITGKQRVVNNADTAAITLERTTATTGAYNLGVDGDGAYRLSSASQVHQQIDDQGISYYRAYTDMTFGTGSLGTERMRVDSAGGVSIGHTSANNSKLHLKGSGGAGTPQLMITDSTSGRQSEIRHDTSGNLVFDHWTGSSRAERLRLDSAGTLNIATTGGTWSGFTGKIENYLSSWANWGTSGTLFAHNARYDGTNYVALGTGKASRIWLNSNGMLNFETADSATAGSAVTYQNLMSLKKDSPTYQEVMEISSADRTLSTGQGAGIVFKGKINTDGSTTQLAQIVGFRDDTTNGYTSGGLSFYTRAVYTNPMVERIRIDESGGIVINGINDLRADEAVVIGNSNSNGANQVAHLKVRDDIGKAAVDNGFSIFSVSKSITANTSTNIIRFRNREGAGVGHFYYGYSGGGIGRVKIDKVAFTYSESTLTNEIDKTRGSETLGLSISSSGDTHTVSVLANQSVNVTLTLLINSCGISSATHATNIDKL